MEKLQKQAFLIWSMILLLCSIAGAAQRVGCSVVIVDVEGKSVSNAEVVIYELESDWNTDRKKINVLSSGQANSSGQFKASFDCMMPRCVMVVACKAGYALGWDVLPYKDFARPTCYIILDKPVSLSGQVVDHQGRPVANARVQALPKTGKLERLEQSPVFGPSKWMTVNTDSNGCFEFKCFGEEVSADFWITAAGSSTTYKFTPHSTSSCGYQVGQNDICLALPKRTEIRGCVVDDQGDAVSGMTVVIRRNPREEGYFKNDYVPLSCQTDAKGRFSFINIPAVSHFLGALNTDVSKPWVDKTTICNAADLNQCENIKIQLDHGGILELRMVDKASQKPIRDMMLILSKKPEAENEWWFRRIFRTDSDGRVKAMCPIGQCGFRFWDDRYQRNEDLKLPLIKKGKTVAAEFELEPNESLKGVVRNPDGSVAQNVIAQMTWGQRVLTDSTGAFKISYDDFRENMVAMACDVKNNRAAFEIIGDPREPVNLTLAPAKTMTGQITDTKGQPIPAARVSVSIRGPGYLSGGCPEVLTDRKGKFTFRAIPGDLPEDFSFRLSVSTMNHGAFSYKRLNVQQQSDRAIELKSIQMSEANQTMDGIVLDRDGKPAPLLPIFVQGEGQYERTASTDQNGRFLLRRLREGEVRLQAGIGPEGFEPGRVTAHSGDTNVKIFMGQSRRHVPEVTIKGRQIPKWDSIQFQDDWNTTQSKPLLICFWDYQQRPSRHVVGQLASMKETFKKQNLTVVLLHAAPMDDKVREWLETKNTDYEVGGLPKESEDVCKKWGVRSLPWLILTDAEHEVLAEGFSVAELEHKLGE